MSKLSDHGWSSDVDEGDPNAKQAAADHELRIAERCRLDDATDEGEKRADKQSSFSSPPIGNVRRGEGSSEATNEDDRCDEAFVRCIRVTYIWGTLAHDRFPP
jgi:hypothetical protein